MKPFSLDVYNAIPRVVSMVLSPDGTRLVLTVQEQSSDRTRFVTSLWELRTDGSTEPRRLTFSDKGESSPAFLPDGSLVFASARPDPITKDDESEGRVWRLPAGGGEARVLLSVPGGVSGLTTARAAAALVIKAHVLPGTDGLQADAEKAKRRKEAGASGVLFDGYPVRYWDQDLGPRQARPLRLTDANSGRGDVEDLAPDAGQALTISDFALSPDGRTLLCNWMRPVGRAFSEDDLVALEDGRCRTLATGADYSAPAVSPDGHWVVSVRRRRGTPDLAPDDTLWLAPLEGGEGRDLTPDLDLWPAIPTWSADGRTVYFTADEQGQAPVFRVDVASGQVTKVAGNGAFSSVCPAPDGGAVYALRSSWSSPNEIVRIDTHGTVTTLPTPGLPLDLPGALTQVTCRADDDQELRAWLLLPEDASPERPAPLAVFIHGGPLSSWNAWSWRWCPHLLVERGYAVLLPDPALSTGYGHDFIARGHGQWGGRPYTDLMAITDATVARADIDQARTAMMGGSFGGYMANWIAGHTTRFAAIVSHAGLWDLDQMFGTTDLPSYWRRIFGDPVTRPERYLANSPHRHAGQISTPLLVIHGDKDYRVPVSEALRLWWDLRGLPPETRFLYFPDENHWILKPGHVTVWYETVLAFLAQHVLGQEWQRPELL